jgi:type I restriction enzyme M protein
VRVVAELQNFSLLSTDIDIKGKAYEEIVGSNLKGDRGQFFTPRNVMEMSVAMLRPKSDERVLDPACGTGGFLVTAMLSAMNELQESFSESLNRGVDRWQSVELQAFEQRLSEAVATNYFGMDITPELVKASKMNMVMNNDGSANVMHADSLLPPYMWPIEFRRELSLALNRGAREDDPEVSPNSLRTSKDISLFDVVVTNPPFGTKIQIKDRAILEHYDLGHIWERNKESHAGWKITDRLQSGVPPEQLFVERCVQFLRPGGRMAIVLPDSILSSPGLGFIRQWVLSKCRLVASIDLHVDTFQPMVGVQTSILVLQKLEVPLEYSSLASGDLEGEVFMAMVEKVGHDKRGQTVYKRDQYGREVLEEVLERISIGHPDERLEKSTRKVVDDECPLVPLLFSEWKQENGIRW